MAGKPWELSLLPCIRNQDCALVPAAATLEVHSSSSSVVGCVKQNILLIVGDWVVELLKRHLVPGPTEHQIAHHNLVLESGAERAFWSCF